MRYILVKCGMKKGKILARAIGVKMKAIVILVLSF